MKQYDVFIAGGGMSGSVMARYAAKGGLKTLFVEKCKTPRTKPCSGIQFNYFEKILGEKIPPDRLCNKQITKTKMYFHDGTTFNAPFSAFNYMRKTFDNWLNILARENGAEFRDECEFLDFEEVPDGLVVTIQSRGKEPEKIKARYAVDATGLSALPLRKKLRPQDFGEKAAGGGMNYYVDGEADIDPNALYQFWDLKFSDSMFAWIYTKTLDDGKDYWCIGTGAVTDTVKERQELFFNHVKEKFNVTGKIVEVEEFVTAIDVKSGDRVWLGEGRVLMVGDAAGLLDGVRGVGQDAAALSGRFAAMAIIESDKKGTSALDEYKKLAHTITTQTKNNQAKEIDQFETNDELKKHIKSSMFSMGIKMMYHTFLNKFRSLENLRLLPP
ncbi:MAG: NAD(P)/FAD-dependent oxidoreductase [Desulfobacteraceae bacterium]|jgi:flavin-dependent dehydrogenase|nr:NAD(P)/FAD-dependent oxidoreductase [Desulfobacteraceae bacterium]